jgi:hypothetical protein
MVIWLHITTIISILIITRWLVLMAKGLILIEKEVPKCICEVCFPGPTKHHTWVSPYTSLISSIDFIFNITWVFNPTLLSAFHLKSVKCSHRNLWDHLQINQICIQNERKCYFKLEILRKLNPVYTKNLTYLTDLDGKRMKEYN